MTPLFYLPDIILALAAGVACVYHGPLYGMVIMLLWVILLLYRVLNRLTLLKVSLRSLDLVVPVLNTIIGQRPGQQGGGGPPL